MDGEQKVDRLTDKLMKGWMETGKWIDRKLMVDRQMDVQINGQMFGE